ncbi:MAG: PhoX family phosphatase [Rhodocyclaceae bacterium]|nr:PhoX family phosphatase [Rhodocyclaceae bacterium]
MKRVQLPASNPTLKDGFVPPLSRRALFKAAGAIALLQAIPAWARKGAGAPFSFSSVPLSEQADTVVVPPGYRWRVMAAWGDRLDGSGAGMPGNASHSAAEQAALFGMHHDGCALFTAADLPDRGLWVTNHEYLDDGLLHRDGTAGWSAEKVAKAQAAVGVSVCHVQKRAEGGWVVVPGPLARRVTATTPCGVSGPAAGHALLQTAADPTGERILGTFANCAMGVTPWGTYLTCEENFDRYFYKSGKPSAAEARIGLDDKGLFRWHEHDTRFDAGNNPDEFHRFGWVVEVDPHDVNAPPVKRTALGRFKHESATVKLARDGRVVVYSGDDQKGEYIYKFVSRDLYDARLKVGRAHWGRLLDEGTLHVARIRDDGVWYGDGEWVPLVWGQNGLTPEKGFADQAAVLVHARMAADAVGATPMDRPEWIAAHPSSGEVYVSLTNNSERGKKVAVNGANPRPNNAMGHILRILEQDNDAGATSFRWSVFVNAGDPEAKAPEHRGNVNGDWFGSPDGLWFDPRGILWTQTDVSADKLGQGPYARMTNNMMFACDTETGEFRRFLIGPKGCEITGVAMSPDLRTLFINIQHPGESPTERLDPARPTAISSWPDPAFGRPRSASICIWREDGAEVGV